MADSGEYTPETIATRQRIADQLLLNAVKPREIRHWAQGLGQLGEAALGGYLGYKAEEEQKQGTAAQAAAIASLLSGGSPASPAATSSPAPTVAPMQEAAAPAFPPLSDANAPRGIRNNNPLNIEAGSFTQGQPGFAGSDGRFAKFDTPEAGMGAANKLLDIYQNKHGLNTVAGIVGRWAPSSDGNNVSAYAQNVAQRLGIDPNAPIPPEMRPQLIAAMGQHENGRPIGDVAAALNKPQPSGVAAALAQPQQVAQAGTAPDNRSAIAKMLNDPNPYVRKMGIQLGQGLITKQLENDKPTDEMREYNLYRQQGGKDNFFDYKSGLKRAGAQNITIDQKGQTSFEQEAGKVQAKRFDELASEAPKAKQMMADVQTLTELGKNIGTGKGAQVKAALGPYAEALGIKIDGLDEIQAFEAIVNRVAPSLRVPGSGAQSDYELKNFLKSLPNLGNTEGGNEIAASVMQGLYQNKLKAAEIGSQALNGQISRPDAEKALRELPDPLEPYREFMKKNKAATAPAAAPDRAAIEAEMRRRKLIP